MSPNCFLYEDEDQYYTLVRQELHAIANQVVHATPEEQNLPRLTRSRLKRLSSWPEWQQAEFAQLDAMAKQNMYGSPCTAPKDAIVLRQHWTYTFKADGRRKARNCCDGSPRAAPNLRLADTYSSCVEQPCVRLFLALVAQLGYLIYSADATNAYANSPPPSQPTYVYIDDAYRDWYFSRFGVKLDYELVLPVQHALQGHPESGKLWETLIHGRLTQDFGLRATTHERNLYVGEYNGHRLLCCRQVDDLLFASDHSESILEFIATLGKSGIDLHADGLTTGFNGVDIYQTQHYIKLSCESYLLRFLKYHGWDSPAQREGRSIDGHHHREPLSSIELKRLQTSSGPLENSEEALALSRRLGFSYRSVLGELMYAYVVGRLDIAYPITQLAKYCQAPSEAHYQALRRVAFYLRHTIDWGLHFWKPSPITDPTSITEPILPPGSLVRSEVPHIDSLPPFPPIQRAFTLFGFVDAAHATDPTTRRSVSGYAFTYGGTVVAYRCKLQSTVATSSTEAEFIAAVSAAKVAKYLRSILSDLGHLHDGPTILFEDNEAAIYMANHGRPTERSRHIDIQHFALLEWCTNGDVQLASIPTTIQPADALTKACGSTLHYRHMGRLMGYFLGSDKMPP